MKTNAVFSLLGILLLTASGQTLFAAGHAAAEADSVAAATSAVSVDKEPTIVKVRTNGVTNNSNNAATTNV